MSIGKNINHYKSLLSQGTDLLLLRLQILRLDLTSQVAGLIRILAMVAFSAVLLLLGGISLLFGLNSVLSPEAKLWAFFGVAGACLLLIIILLLMAMSIWQNRNQQVGNTLRDIQNDLAYLRGQAQDEPNHTTKEQA